MFKKIRKVNFEEFYKVNEQVAKTSPMMTHYHSPNPAERWLWGQKKKRVKSILEKLPIKNIVDFGCGDGGMLHIVPSSVTYHGIDISPTQASYAKKTIKELQRKNATVSVGDILKLNIKDNSCDAALLCDVVEHVLEPNTLLKEAKRIVKNDGYIIISIPHEFLWLMMRAFLFRFPLHSPDHLHEIEPKDIRESFNNIEREIHIPFSFSPKFSLIHVFLIKNVK